jgi:hypothetical protein
LQIVDSTADVVEEIKKQTDFRKKNMFKQDYDQVNWDLKKVDQHFSNLFDFKEPTK